LRSADDDQSDMTTQDFTPDETERLIAGRGTSIDPAVADAISALRHGALIAPSDEYVAKVAALAAAEVPQAATPASAVPVWRRRLVAALAVAGVMVVGGAGMASAADSANPGDALYSLDRALENIGIGDGGADERYDEGAEEDGDEETASQLLAVAQQLRENGSEQSADVHERVATMLEWMATTDATGKEFGQGVSLHARGLWVDEPGEDDGTVDPSPSPSPSVSPEDDVTKPGKPDGAGKPDNPGKPDGAGKPHGVGKPASPGKSAGKGKG
jgi:hypothetical protein